jgi:septal ring factor EnvC (AmiA/AmiB activator)
VIDEQKSRGERNMRTVFIFLFVVFIGFGFLLSDYLHAQKDLAVLQAQVEQVTKEKESLQKQLEGASTTIAELNQTVDQLEQQVADYKEKVRQLEITNKTLDEKSLALQQKTDQLSAWINLTETLKTTIKSSLNLAIFLPVIPISLVATYKLVQRNKNSPQRNNISRSSRPSTSVQLTDHELREIIRMRRTQ